jgi:hypothetical protein
MNLMLTSPRNARSKNGGTRVPPDHKGGKKKMKCPLPFDGGFSFMVRKQFGLRVMNRSTDIFKFHHINPHNRFSVFADIAPA